MIEAREERFGKENDAHTQTDTKKDSVHVEESQVEI
jgi:hypothetical protein